MPNHPLPGIQRPAPRTEILGATTINTSDNFRHAGHQEQRRGRRRLGSVGRGGTGPGQRTSAAGVGPKATTRRPCEVVPTTEQLTVRLLVLSFFLGKQHQQHLVPILVARRIAFALDDEPPIMFDVCVVDEAVHFDFHWQAGWRWYQYQCPVPDTTQDFLLGGRLNAGQPYCPIKAGAALGWALVRHIDPTQSVSQQALRVPLMRSRSLRSSRPPF
jgi:hypothetical protein